MIRLSALRSKYYAIPTMIDGIRFDSKREAARYGELRLLERLGEITDLRCQPRYELAVLGMRLGEYRADFAYTRHGQVQCEDVKGFDTPLSRWKRKHVQAQYGIAVQVLR